MLLQLGPRLTLQLVKIEAGLCEGEVLHHEYGETTPLCLSVQSRRVPTAVQKSWQEKRQLRCVKDGQRRLKESRKKEQAANVARKQREKEEHKARCLAGMEAQGGEGDQEDEGGQEEDQGSSDEDDREWFRREVGEEPDRGVLLGFCLPNAGWTCVISRHTRAILLIQQ